MNNCFDINHHHHDKDCCYYCPVERDFRFCFNEFTVKCLDLIDKVDDCHDNLFILSSDPRNNQTDVSPDIKSIKLILAYNFFKSTSLEIDMWQGTNKVPIRIKKSWDECNGYKNVYVIPRCSLIGGVLYKVRIKAFFKDRCGNIHKDIEMITFTTRCR